MIAGRVAAGILGALLAFAAGALIGFLVGEGGSCEAVDICKQLYLWCREQHLVCEEGLRCPSTRVR